MLELLIRDEAEQAADLHVAVAERAAFAGEPSAGLLEGAYDEYNYPIRPNSALGELEAAVDCFRSRCSDRTTAELRNDMRRLSHVRDLLDLEFSLMASQFARSDEIDWFEGNAINDIRHECKMSGIAASNAVSVGDNAEKLALSVDALEAGRIGFGHLALMSSTIDNLRTFGTADRVDELQLLNQALEHSVSRFRFDCAHARHAADAEQFLRDEIDAVEYRRLELIACGNGRVEIRGMLDAAGAATVRTALEPLARRSGKDDARLREKRLADALVEAANHVLDINVLPQMSNQRPHVQVTTTLETLRGLSGAPAGDMEFAPPIAAATVRRLACDSNIVRVLMGADSAIIDVGRARRVISPAQRRALVARDKGCVWPGCDRPATWTQGHHVVFWTEGNGPTDLDNMVLLCYRHHWKVHEGAWQLVRSDDGVITTVAPSYAFLSALGFGP